jgi:hypothetical protein
VPYEVEHALALTLETNGILVPLSFLLTVNKDFKPSYPPSKKQEEGVGSAFLIVKISYESVPDLTILSIRFVSCAPVQGET